MSRIYVAFSGLDDMERRLKGIGSKIDTIQADFQHKVQQLDWDIRFHDEIRRTSAQLSEKLKQYAEILTAYQQFLENVGSQYRKLDLNQSDDVLSDLVCGMSILDYDMSTLDVLLGPGGQMELVSEKVLKSVSNKENSG